MIFLEDILQLHKYSIEKQGVSDGLRDSGFLESVIARPFQTFVGKDLYPSIFQKAAALGEFLLSITFLLTEIKEQKPLAMVALLEEEDFYNFIISISTGEISFEEIVKWLEENTNEKQFTPIQIASNDVSHAYVVIGYSYYNQAGQKMRFRFSDQDFFQKLKRNVPILFPIY